LSRAIECAYSRRRGRNRLAREDDLRIYVHEKLKKRWSPRRIVKRMETDFSTVSVRQLKRVQRELNDRPRAVLNYKKPDEVINQLGALKV